MMKYRNEKSSARQEKESVRRELLGRIDDVVPYLYPQARKNGNSYEIGNTGGEEGQSLKIGRSGKKAGVWYDFATSERGDIFRLWAEKHNLDIRTEFPEVIKGIKEWLGSPSSHLPPDQYQSSTSQGQAINTAPSAPRAPTAVYRYTDEKGNLLVTVTRFDSEAGKDFRIFDAVKKVPKCPEPRPLYNRQGLLESPYVILVEGEKAADALISQGVAATTAIGGANTPLNKTDWTPILSKKIIIWPDNDNTGRKFAEVVKIFLEQAGASRNITIIPIPSGYPDKWDAADAVAQSVDVKAFIKRQRRLMANKTKLPKSDFYQGKKALKKALKEQSKPRLDYEYHDADGNLLFTRIALSKEYRVRMPNSIEYTGHEWLPDFARPLYNIQEVLKAPPEVAVVLVQDESHVEALRRHNITATTYTTPPRRALNTVDWSPLKGRNVAVWPVNNEHGKELAKTLRKKLLEIGARSVDIVEIPKDIPLNFKPSDAVFGGWSKGRLLDFIDGYHHEDPQANPAEDTGDAWEPPVSPPEDIGDAWEPPVSPPEDTGSEPAEVSKEPEKIKDDKGCFVLDGYHAEPQPDRELILGGFLRKMGIRLLLGAPKVGKTDFMLNWLTCMAAEKPFLWFQPARPLRVYYLQVELDSSAIHQRLKQLKFDYSTLKKAHPNLYITYRKVTILDEKTVNEVAEHILEKFPKEDPVDLIVIDPLGHVFDGNENNNDEMKSFLTGRLEELRQKVNPDVAFQLVHHLRKIDPEALDRDPFNACSGASYLLRIVDGCDVLYKKNRHDDTITVVSFERHAGSCHDRAIKKENGLFIEVNPKDGGRIVAKEHGEKMDAERRRGYDIILKLIFDEALKGDVFTPNAFAGRFENKFGLGSASSIKRRIETLATKGYIRFFCECDRYGLTRLRKATDARMCVEGMELGIGDKVVKTPEGDFKSQRIKIIPELFKCPSSERKLPVESATDWIYYDEDIEVKKGK